MKNKNIWIINQYSSSPKHGYAGRSYYLSKELSGLGNNVSLISGSYSHLLRNHEIKPFFYDKSECDSFCFLRLRTFFYKNSNSFVRIANWFVFSFLLLFSPFILRKKPDVIIVSSPSLISYLPSYILSKVFKCKIFFEVRDIWPLTLTHLGGWKTNSLPIKFLQKIEDFAYKNSELILSNLPNLEEHIKNRGIKDIDYLWLPNGVLIEDLVNGDPLDDDEVKQFSKFHFNIGYVGTIGEANALEAFFDAILKMRTLTHFKFFLVGDGSLKETYKDFCLQNNISNVVFIDSVSKNKVHSYLKVFDCLYLGWHDSPLYKFGVAPNKVPEYFLSAKPVIQSYSGSGDSVSLSGAGFTVPANDSESLVKAFCELSKLDPQQLSTLGDNGYKFALSNFDYKKIAIKLNLAIQGRSN